MTFMGLYAPGMSPLHRARASTKLTALALLEVGALLGIRNLQTAAIAVSGLLAGYWAANLPIQVARDHLRGVAVIALTVLVLQLFTSSLERGLIVATQLVVSVGIAALLTATTTTADLLDAIEGAARRLQFLGIDPSVLALTFSLAMRSVVIIASLSHGIREACQARNVTPPPLTLVTWIVLRTLEHADALTESLEARGGL